MLNMLIVDDDKFEREGVKFLIGKYGFELETAEADSGESALDYIKGHEVDILFSDIRMKGMDGLQLAEKVRELGRPIKVIFMSAYGEFEYAQRAIDLKAIRYILKPVQVSEFIKVVSQVIQLCEEERQSKVQQEKLKESYLKEVRYEKQKLLTDLIVGRTEGEQEELELPELIAGLEGSRYVRVLMIDSRSRFFDRLDLDFERQLMQAINRGFELVHLNEFQSLLIVEAYAEESKDTLTALGHHLIRWFRDTYEREVTVVVSGIAGNSQQLYKEYNAMETMLENKFFFDESTVLLTNFTSFTGGDTTSAVNDALEELVHNIRRNRYDMTRLRFDQLFDMLQNSEHFSVIYVKYVCTEIAKAIFDASAKKNTNKFKVNLENIYKTTKLSDLRKVVLSILEENEAPAEPAGDSTSKAIEEVVRTIEHEYASDLSLDSLAEKVYLSPSYLSYLFKKQKGISINKYLTLYRMEQAKELLLSTNRKIVDIGKDVGYVNFPYFSSLFKNHYGKTPSQFREEAVR